MSHRIYLNIHRKLSLLSGLSYPLPENYENRSKCFRFLWSTYVYFPYAFMAVELVFQFVVYIVQFLVKVFVFRRNRQKFDRIFDEMTAISMDLMQNPLEEGDTFLKIFDYYYKTVTRIGIVKGSMQMISNQSLVILFLVLNWTGRKQKMTPAYSWTPYDISGDPGYTLTVLIEMVAYGAVTARNGVFDLLFWVMIIIPMVQLNYLKYLMEIMLKDPDDEYDIKRIEGNDIVSETAVSEEVLSEQLEWWIKIHQRILGMVSDFETLASPFLAINFLGNMVDLFSSGLMAISSANWDISERIVINGILLTDAFQLYVVSLAGDWLRESSQTVADFGFSTLIFKMGKDIRRKYMFILTRTRSLIKLRFGGIYLLSSQTFLGLIQVTVTYFITVLQLQHSHISEQTIPG